MRRAAGFFGGLALVGLLCAGVAGFCAPPRAAADGFTGVYAGHLANCALRASWEGFSKAAPAKTAASPANKLAENASARVPPSPQGRLSAGSATPGASATASATEAEGAVGAVTAAQREALRASVLQSKLAAIFLRYRTMGAVVCVLENGIVTQTFPYGQLNPEGAPITADTLFRVGSISKMVTAMGVMRLVEEGKLTLDGDVSQWLGFALRNPQYPDTPITLRQIMSHTAGLRDSTFYTQALLGSPQPLPDFFAGALARVSFRKDAAPGAKAVYSNFGGGLLGSVLEQVTGKTVDAYMAETIFRPLGITAAYQSALLPASATVSDLYSMPGRRLLLAVRDGEPAVNDPDPMLDYTLTAGKLTLSAPDLAKLLAVLCQGGVAGEVRVLSEASVLAMRQVQNGVGSVTGNSGRGLCLNLLEEAVVPGHTLVGHGGKAYGMLCAAYVDPLQRNGVVMLTNGCNNIPMVQGIGKLSYEVLRLCYREWLDPRNAAKDAWLVE